MTQHSYVSANDALTMLLKKLLREGQLVPSRNGDTKELLMEQFTLRNPLRRYITVPGRNVSLPAQIAETMWLLAGRDDIGWLENYLPRAKDFSDDGEIWRGAYGPRIREWQTRETVWAYDKKCVDQLEHVVNLLKSDPDTRRAVITIYDPAIDTKPGKDIPCNNWVHLIQREGKLHGHVTIRSNDVFWGWSGINQFEWSALLEIVAGLVGMQVGTLTFSVSSLHLYERHWGRAEKLATEGARGAAIQALGTAPTFSFGGTLEEFDRLVEKWFRVEKMIREEPRGSAWMPIHEFPEPMLKSWLQALYVWWHGLQDEWGMENELDYALEMSPKRKKPEPVVDSWVPAPVPEGTNFVDFVAQLHREKHAAYGDSWKKRGEMLGIMANIARKMDRLGVAGGGDTAADTAIDLLVYLIKYSLWITQEQTGTDMTSNPEYVTGKLRALVGTTTSLGDKDIIASLEHDFQHLEMAVTETRHIDKVDLVNLMIPNAYTLALRLWTKEQKEAWKAGNEKRIWKGYDA